MQKTVELTTPRDSFSSSSKFLIEVGKNNLTIYASNHACHQWTLLINDERTLHSRRYRSFPKPGAAKRWASETGSEAGINSLVQLSSLKAGWRNPRKK